jgi:hypothetical protein
MNVYFHAPRTTHHAPRTMHHSWLMKIKFFFLLLFLSVSFSDAQICVGTNVNPAPSQDFTTLKNAIPKTKTAANFGKLDADIPRIKDMIGVNALSTDDAGFELYKGLGVDGAFKNVNQIFKHIRVFTPSNKDFRYTHQIEPCIYTNPDDGTTSTGECQITIAQQRPLGNIFMDNEIGGNDISNLCLVIDDFSKLPTGANLNSYTKFLSPVIQSSAGNPIQIREKATGGAYGNVYLNYLNTNYIHIRDLRIKYGSPLTLAFDLTASVLKPAEQASYGFPNNWFLEADWGNTDERRRLNAKAYAKMIARTYAPTAADVPNQSQYPYLPVVDMIEVGNEPWGYSNASTYHAILQGFIEGIDEYYQNDATNKIKILPAAFQANRAENGTAANSSDDATWKDYMNTRICSSTKSSLVGINIHPYSNDITDNIAGNYFKKRLIAYPEQTSADNAQVQSRFLYLLNAWQWLNANSMKKQDLYASEFGWDSDTEGVVCNESTQIGSITSVGYFAQAIYTIRSMFMMSRYGVKRATWYELKDDKGIKCPFAHFGGGIWKNQANPTTPKYIFKALDKLIAKAGDLKFHYALKEWEGNNKDVFAYILEENNTPKYMVAWRAVDVKDKTIAQMQALSQVENINITVNGVNYGADYSQPQNWWQLDGENNTPINPSVYNPATGAYKLSPIPILIPIKSFCNENSFAMTSNNVTIPAGTIAVSQNNIGVPSGSTLTIRGKLLMAKDKNIFVYGTLIVDGGTVSTACDGTQWGGIQAQPNGSTITINNGKIEHSSLGIDNWGGNAVINVTNTAFINNERDFLIIDGSSPLNIKSCTFTLNDNYRTTTANQRINLIRTDNVNILGCKFLNNITNTSAFTNCSWYAIQGTDAGFKVGNDANGYTTTIENFFYGVRADRISANRTFEVKNATFNGVTVGIECNGYNGITVTNNQFNINPNNMPVIPFRAGLIINTGTGYTVNNNQFVGASGTTFGTYIINTGTAPNSINKNNYSNLSVGNRAIEVNRNSDGTGLIFSCNTHKGCKNDIRVENAWYNLAGIAENQGSMTTSDGNSFSQNGSGNDADYWSESLNNINQHYFQGIPQSEPTVGGANAPNKNQAQAPKDCSTNASPGSAQRTSSLTTIELTDLTITFEDAETALKNAKNEYSRVADGGDKPGLIDKIKNRWNRDSAAMRQNLLSQSPNLSAEVLLEAAKTNILSRNNLMQLLKANINSCRDRKFHNSLMLEIPIPLTATDIQQLRNTPTNRSRKLELEIQIGELSQKKEAASRQIIRGLLSDRSVDIVSLRNWYDKTGNLEDQYALAETYIKETNSNQSIAKLRQLSALLANTGKLLTEHEDYIELYGIKSTILKSKRKWEELNPSEERAIRRIAANTRGIAAVQAQNILCAVYKECPFVDIPMSAETIQALKIPIVSQGNTTSASKTTGFVAYPNPASSTFSIAYDFKEDMSNAEIIITDAITGKTIVTKQIEQERGVYNWNLSGVHQGIYYVYVKNDSKLVWQTKAFVLK